MSITVGTAEVEQKTARDLLSDGKTRAVLVKRLGNDRSGALYHRSPVMILSANAGSRIEAENR